MLAVNRAHKSGFRVGCAESLFVYEISLEAQSISYSIGLLFVLVLVSNVLPCRPAFLRLNAALDRLVMVMSGITNVSTREG